MRDITGHHNDQGYIGIQRAGDCDAARRGASSSTPLTLPKGKNQVEEVALPDLKTFYKANGPGRKGDMWINRRVLRRGSINSEVHPCFSFYVSEKQRDTAPLYWLFLKVLLGWVRS